MSTHFSRTLSLLRQERRISQREASKELGISQALMSHYETGAREPGLAFVIKACDYYGVSADFILGRTLIRDGSQIHVESLHDAAREKGNVLSGSAAALLGRKMVVNSISLIFEEAGASGNKTLITEITRYFGSAIYKIFRHIYQAWGEAGDTFFPAPKESGFYMAQADMDLAEAKIAEALAGRNHEKKLSSDLMSKKYPALVQSLLTLVHQSGERSGKLGK